VPAEAEAPTEAEATETPDVATEESAEA